MGMLLIYKNISLTVNMALDTTNDLLLFLAADKMCEDASEEKGHVIFLSFSLDNLIYAERMLILWKSCLMMS